MINVVATSVNVSDKKGPPFSPNHLPSLPTNREAQANATRIKYLIITVPRRWRCSAGPSVQGLVTRRRNIHIELVPGSQIIIACVDYLVAGRVLVVVNGYTCAGHIWPAVPPLTRRNTTVVASLAALFKSATGTGKVHKVHPVHASGNCAPTYHRLQR